MKIFYAVQATGNGHISRAIELLPHLENYGEVDIFLSGSNSNLEFPIPVKYRSKGLSLHYNCTGGLDYWEIMKGFHPLRLRQEIRDLPVEKYDLVINDFEYITAAACARKNIASVNFGHQASFHSNQTPRPGKRSQAGEWVLKNYARADRYIGLHFMPYDDFIFTPIIKKAIREAETFDLGYITVYLPSFCERQLKKIFQQFPDVEFEIFCGETKKLHRDENIIFLPVKSDLFNQSLIHCHGIITGGGFETPAEAIHLKKKLLAIPIRNQYEQLCNAAALKQMGITTISCIDENFSSIFHQWMNAASHPTVDYKRSVEDSLHFLFTHNAQSSHANKAEHVTV